MSDEKARRGRTKKVICGICGIEYDDNGESNEDGVCNNCVTDILNFIDDYREDDEEE